MFYKIAIGWACGYTWSDYWYDERAEINKLLAKYGYQNPFARRKTTRFPFHVQLDHILVPNKLKITKKRMFKVPLSDHKALMVEVEIA